MIEIDSDLADWEFPFHPERLPDLLPINQLEENLQNLPTNQNQAERPEVGNQVVNTPVEEPELDQPPFQPVPMANQQLNWSHFKPEFSGKPGEDADMHLLRTQDWMDTHDFTENQMVKQFCLTLASDTRNWYETVRNVQLDWPALQRHFRQKFSKHGNNRDQYYQMWRNFHFDESVDDIDSYVTRVKQIAVLLNYGDPEMLELLRNTLQSRLYYLIYRENNLEEVIEIAKTVLTKEKLEKEKTGQATVSSFMHASMDRSRRSRSRRGLSFDALDTKESIDKNRDSINKLTSVVNKIDMKLDRREALYRPTVYQNRNRGCGQRQINHRSRNRSQNRDREQIFSNNRGRENSYQNRDYRPNYRTNNRPSNNYVQDDYRRNVRYSSRANNRHDDRSSQK